MVAVLRKDIMRFMMTERIVRRVWMYRRRWMLHGNVSRKGYGNDLIGRYGGCSEVRYKEVYDDRAYRAKGLDVPTKVDANSRSEKEAMHGAGEARKIWEGGSVNFRILILV